VEAAKGKAYLTRTYRCRRAIIRSWRRPRGSAARKAESGLSGPNGLASSARVHRRFRPRPEKRWLRREPIALGSLQIEPFPQLNQLTWIRGERQGGRGHIGPIGTAWLRFACRETHVIPIFGVLPGLGLRLAERRRCLWPIRRNVRGDLNLELISGGDTDEGAACSDRTRPDRFEKALAGAVT
jgi:hypothetical protein